MSETRERERREELSDIKREIAGLQSLLDTLRARVSDLEQGAGPSPAAPPDTKPEPEPSLAERIRKPVAPPPLPVSPPPPPPVRSEPPKAPPPADAASEPEQPTRLPLPSDREEPAEVAASVSMEARIGERWFNWVGIIAILFGMGYFLKYTFDQGWITPRMQFYIGILLGLGMIALAHIAERKHYAALARGLWGGGVGILYLSFFAGFKILEDPGTGAPVLSQPVAFAGMAVATILGAVIAVVYRTRAVVTLIAIGGYLTPLLLRTGEASQAFLFTYLSILTAGLLFMGNRLRWRFLAGLSFTAMVLYFAGWWMFYYPGNENLTLLFVSIFFVLFSAEIVVAALTKTSTIGPWSSVLLACNSLLFVLAAQTLVFDFHKAFEGASILAIGAYHLAAALVLARRAIGRGFVTLLYAYIAAVLFLLFPLLEDGVTEHWITVCWTVQGFALFAAGLRWGGGHTRGWGMAGLALAAIRILAWDAPRYLLDADPYVILLSSRGFTFGTLIAAYAATSWIHGRISSVGERSADGAGWLAARTISPAEKRCGTLVLIMAVTLPIVLMSLEIRDGFNHFLRPLLSGNEQRFAQVSGHWMTLVWFAYATVVTIIARRRSHPWLEYAALVFAAVTLAKLSIGDLAITYARSAVLLLNCRTLTTLPITGCLFWLGREFARRGPADTALPRLSPAAHVLGHLLLQAVLCMEWLDVCNVHQIGLTLSGEPVGLLAGASRLGVALLWGLHGTAIVLRLTRRGGSTAMLETGFGLAAFGGAAWLLYICSESAVPAEALCIHFRFITGAILAALAVVMASRCRRPDAACPERDTVLALWPTVACVAHVFLVIVGSVEIRDLFYRYHGVWTPRSALSVVNGSGFVLPALWAVYGAGLVIFGIRIKRRHARLLGVGGILCALSYAVLWQICFSYEHVYSVVFNSRFLGSLLTAAAMTWCAFRYRAAPADLNDRPAPEEASERETLIAPLLIAANGLMILVLSLEAHDYFSTRADTVFLPAGIDISDARQMTYSMIWTVYSIAIVFGGFIWSVKPLRIMALLLLGVTVFKVFLFDLSFLEGLYRVLSFFVLGCILVGVSFLYHRFKAYLLN